MYITIKSSEEEDMKKCLVSMKIFSGVIILILSLTTYGIAGPYAGNGVSSYSHGKVIVNGITLSSSDVAELKTLYGFEPQPGSYWYDARCGLYGVVGYPAYGVMYAGHDFGSLSSTVSNGNTGVYLNGRELPQEELYYWSQLLGSWIQPGSYWLDQNGNAGYEGSDVPLVNLYIAAQNNSSSPTGGNGDNFWSTNFSAGNSNSNGEGYVSVPGHGPVGFGF
jgi:hypothetical protein